MIKRIRDAERVLRKKLAANGQEENDETAELRKKIEELRESKKEQDRGLRERKLAKKYHMVKFVERQKLVRKISEFHSFLSDYTVYTVQYLIPG